MPSRPVGGVWLRDYLLCFAKKNGNIYKANISSILQYCHGMSIEGVLVFYRTTELHCSQYANSWGGGA